MDSPRLGIIADDVTGAADTAAALARPGAPVRVWLGPRPLGPVDSAVAVTTDSRHRAADQAAEVTRESAAALRDAGATLLYKKIDSNLRGNVAVELAAAMSVVRGPVLLAPAFPQRGRTTVGGIQCINGVPVAETEMRRDPQAPVVCSHVAELLAAAVARVELCPLEVVRASPEAIRARLCDGAVLVCDAETDADLEAAAQAALGHPEVRLIAGCAGLAAALARRLFGERPRPTWPEARRGSCLAVLASASATLAAQVEHAAAQDIAAIPFSCARLTEEGGALPELRETIARTIAALAAGRDALVYSIGTAGSRLVSSRYDPARWVEIVVEHLAHLALVSVRQGRPRALLVGGGSTAQGVLGALGVTALEVDDEPLPGLAAGRMVGGELDGRPVALKPGAAGGPEAVSVLMWYLGKRA